MLMQPVNALNCFSPFWQLVSVKHAKLGGAQPEAVHVQGAQVTLLGAPRNRLSGFEPSLGQMVGGVPLAGPDAKSSTAVHAVPTSSQPGGAPPSELVLVDPPWLLEVAPPEPCAPAPPAPST
jgi:hypothetical protein